MTLDEIQKLEDSASDKFGQFSEFDSEALYKLQMMKINEFLRLHPHTKSSMFFGKWNNPIKTKYRITPYLNAGKLYNFSYDFLIIIAQPQREKLENLIRAYNHPRHTLTGPTLQTKLMSAYDYMHKFPHITLNWS